jgi:hypothetical protein
LFPVLIDYILKGHCGCFYLALYNLPPSSRFCQQGVVGREGILITGNYIKIKGHFRGLIESRFHCKFEEHSKIFTTPLFPTAKSIQYCRL